MVFLFSDEQIGSDVDFVLSQDGNSLKVSNGKVTATLPYETREFAVYSGLRFELRAQGGVLIATLLGGRLTASDDRKLRTGATACLAYKPALELAEGATPSKFWVSVTLESKPVFTDGTAVLPFPEQAGLFAITRALIVQVLGPDESGTFVVQPVAGRIYGNMDKIPVENREGGFCPARMIILEMTDDGPSFKEICDLPVA